MVELTATELNSLYQTTSRNWKSVHDPSVVWDEATETFYIYGSHYYGVKTKNFKTFNDITRYYKGAYESKDAYKAFQSNPVHTVKRCLPGVTEVEEVELGSFDAAAFCATYAGIQVGNRAPTTEAEWVSGDQWAPDIIYNPNMNKWCLYLSLNGDYWASVIVLLTSDSPTGPFTYEAPIVFGGFDGQSRSGKSVNYKNTDLEVVLGAQSSLPSRYKTSAWGNLWPNCIDPCASWMKRENCGSPMAHGQVASSCSNSTRIQACVIILTPMHPPLMREKLPMAPLSQATPAIPTLANSLRVDAMSVERALTFSISATTTTSS